MNKRRWLAALAGIGCVALAAAACGGDDDDDAPAGEPSPTPTAAGVTGSAAPKSELGKKINETAVPEASANGKRIGPADAKVVIEAYEDFGCPHCLDFTATIEPVIFKEYLATGKVAFEYKFFPLRQLTAGAAIAAHCAAEQNRFWPYHRALFIAQAEANEKVGPSLTQAFALEGLQGIGEQVGLDSEAFDTCVSGDAALDAVQADLRQANDLKLPGTPSFVINGKVTPTPETAADWRKLLDGLLK